MRRAPELLWAALTVAAAAALYAWLAHAPQTAPGAVIGHSLGIAGFVLMLFTETGYSLRKRSHRARWGPMKSWLRIHIYTGIVGPALILLHTSWRFSGLAGWTAIAVAVVVVSGFVGRYLYTAIPRTVAGVELSPTELAGLLGDIDTRLAEAEVPESERRQLAAARARLQKRVKRVPRMRRLLALWHTVHVPLGVAMFTLAFTHVAIAIWFSAGVR